MVVPSKRRRRGRPPKAARQDDILRYRSCHKPEVKFQTPSNIRKHWSHDQCMGVVNKDAADKTLEAADLDTTGNANTPRGVTSQPESLAKDIPPESAASPSPTPGATAPPKRGRGRPRKTPRSAGPSRAEDPPVHCTCRRPDDGKLMIQCDRCDIWFHGQCVGVTVEEAQRMDEYVCPPCSSVSISPCRKWKPAHRRAHRKRRPRCIPQGTEGGQDSRVTPRGRVSVPNPSRGGR